jgi:hypothetical protein
MKKRYISLTVVGLFSGLVLAITPAALVAAHEGDGTTSHDTPNSTSGSGSSSGSSTDNPTDRRGSDAVRTTTKPETNDDKTTNDDSTTNHSGTGKRLEAAKLKVCEQRQTNITTIMNDRVTIGQKRIDLFTTITTRVEAFYTEKGKTVSNYDQLVAAIDSAKATAVADLAALKTADTFDCNSTDPKGQATTFRAAAEKLRQDMLAYRTAIKNLIVAVKSAQGENQ